MLGGPAPLGARAVVVGPDDLVEKAVAPEDLVEQQLAVVGLAVVDVEVERALRRQQPAGLLQARGEERQVVLEAVAIGGFGEQPGLVAATLKARALAVLVRHRPQRPARLRTPVLNGGSM